MNNIIINPEGTKEQENMPDDKINYSPEHGVWVCSLCPQYDKNKRNTRDHFRNKHVEGRQVKCPDCGETCKSETKLKNHKTRNCIGKNW